MDHDRRRAIGLFHPSETDPSASRSLTPEEVVSAIVDPAWAAHRVLFLETLRESAAGLDLGLLRPREAPLEAVEAWIKGGIRRAGLGAADLDAELQKITNSSDLLGRLHAAAWTREDAAPEWQAAVKSFLEADALGVAGRAGMHQKLLALLRSLPSVTAAWMEAAAGLIKATYAIPSVCEPVFGDFEECLISPAGKVRLPVVFDWTPLPGVDRYRISVLEEDRRSELTEVTAFECAQPPASIEPRGLLLAPGSYAWELKTEPPADGSLSRRYFEVIPAALALEISNIAGLIAAIGEGPSVLDRLLGLVLEVHELYSEAAQRYELAYSTEQDPRLALSIARCFSALKLDGQAAKWTRRASAKDT
ncbi:MAG: hypothetical protein HY721_31155 [Planctomycetes bacterium]|nr:hypothetical protein [Planctomycetota bacterium]